MKPKLKLSAYFIVVLVVVLLFGAGKVLAPIISRDDSEPAAKTFDKTKHSIDKPNSLWVIVNKQRPLPASYAPKNLVAANFKGQPSELSLILIRKELLSPLTNLVADARKEGHKLFLISAYRSFDTQNQVYGESVLSDGKAKADETSARPGHSEHQTGLAGDIGTIDHNCDLKTCFGKTKEGKWLANNAHKYGFIVRYQDGKESITGFTYEPWHIRFVGKNLASEIFATQLTLEQFFGLPNAPGY